VQVGQELGAGEVDLRNQAEEEDDQPHQMLALGQHLEHALAHELHVEVQQRRLTADHQYTRNLFVFRVAHAVGEILCAGNPGELDHARSRGLPEQ